MLLHDAEGGLGTAAQELGHRSLAGLLDPHQEAERREVAGEFVIVEEDPAENLEPLLLVAPAEAPGLFGEICQDRAALGEPPGAMLQHRDLAQLVDILAEGILPGRAGKEIHHHRFPVAAREIQHQRCLVGIARHARAIETVFGHFLTPDPAAGRVMIPSPP